MNSTRKMSGGKRGRKGTKKVGGKKTYKGGANSNMGMGNSGMGNSGMSNSGMGNSGMGMNSEEEQMGGKRNTRKNMSGGKRKASPWNKFVKKIFSEMRRKDKDASFGDALKEASKRKKEM